MIGVTSPIMLGLGRVETTRLLQHKGVFQYLIGLRRYPDPSTLRRFLSRFGRRSLEAFGRRHDRCRTQFSNASAVGFDLDTTVLTVYGQQQNATVGFNPRQRGRPSFHPLFCFEGDSGVCWEAQSLPGHTHPLRVAIPLLERA